MCDNEESELDPRIQIALEKLNATTDEINKLETEYDEANTTFRILLNDSTKRLKSLSQKLGSCIEKARPYYEAVDISKKAQQECQKAAVQFQRANEIHAAARETVALAEQRFMSNQNEWQFDNAWQEMLNHATIKVMDAENEKAECGREHQRRATIYKAAELKVKQLEDKLQRNISKSRPYFDEKTICQAQLNTQKDRIQLLKCDISNCKSLYGQTLRQLEQISNEIHLKRGDTIDVDIGPREPGVGAELESSNYQKETQKISSNSKSSSLPDFHKELDKCDLRSIGSLSGTDSEKDESENLSEDLNDLKTKFKELAVRPVNGGEGESMDRVWESELKNTVDKLDHMMLMQECARELDNYKNTINTLDNNDQINHKSATTVIERF